MKRQVIVYVEGGLVQDVDHPDDVVVHIRDYDVEGSVEEEMDEIDTDEHGRQYHECIYGEE